jgi:hypothetical protein
MGVEHGQDLIDGDSTFAHVFVRVEPDQDVAARNHRKSYRRFVRDAFDECDRSLG